LSPYFYAIAVDFDGTLTAHGSPTPDVLAAVAEVRGCGTKVVLVTGRVLAELREAFPDADDHFDFIVAENGAVLCAEHVPRLLAPPVSFELDEVLLRLGIPFRRGQVVLASHGAWDIAVTEEIRRLGLECQIVRSRADIIILPPGISKGLGVSRPSVTSAFPTTVRSRSATQRTTTRSSRPASSEWRSVTRWMR